MPLKLSSLDKSLSVTIITFTKLNTIRGIAQPLYSAMMAAFILLKPVIAGVFSREPALAPRR